MLFWTALWSQRDKTAQLHVLRTLIQTALVATMQSLGHQPNPSLNALFVPDVLHLICDLLELPDWMALMLTCKSTFVTAASHIWANLDGVKDLTDLLVETPKAGHSKPTQADTSASLSVFLPQSLRIYFLACLVAVRARCRLYSVRHLRAIG